MVNREGGGEDEGESRGGGQEDFGLGEKCEAGEEAGGGGEEERVFLMVAIKGPEQGEADQEAMRDLMGVGGEEVVVGDARGGGECEDGEKKSDCD